MEVDKAKRRGACEMHDYKQTLPTTIPRKEGIEMIWYREMHSNLFFAIYKGVERMKSRGFVERPGAMPANSSLKTSNILRQPASTRAHSRI